MSTASASLTIAGLGVDVVYKNIKHLHISVYPPVGRVRVAAPDRTDEDTIRLAVVQRLPWIKRQREQLQNAARQTKREMLSGETHYVWGQRYRLDASRTSGNYSVAPRGNTLWVVTPKGSDPDTRKAALDRWYRRQLKAAVPDLLAKWEPVIGVEAERFVVRRMKTKWGSCVTDARTIWLNLELAKKNPRCLEYVVVHELIHLLERGHGERFVSLMDQFLPDWRARRDELNEAPLADEDWA
ncbi:M48 family metallopeptidase [Streptomyces griseorubiginosus]|uniref:Metal-dependent hydrolase n=1 Tax=Streptomyces griseorubiginosus TaxID=67304 RepID=A0A124HZT1_9ACTN|nr:SprT family zinc-dependent metalloprotease [Streptomyces griseorubiginosus]KUN72000.1 metal-dependent hydrolase [Streptomyces griseorubiginosus]